MKPKSEARFQNDQKWARSDKIQLASVITTLCALIVALLLYVETRKQVDITREGNQIATRAYYAVIEPGPLAPDSIVNFRRDAPVFASYVETNLGNTPAFEVSANKQLAILPKDELPNVDGSIDSKEKGDT